MFRVSLSVRPYVNDYTIISFEYNIGTHISIRAFKQRIVKRIKRGQVFEMQRILQELLTDFFGSLSL